VEFLEEAKAFLDRLDEKARDKIVYNIWKARSTKDKELFKKLQDEIWEFRTKHNILPIVRLLGKNRENRHGRNRHARIC